jgi:hypothetical protein
MSSMPSDWPVAAALILGIIGLFGVAIFVGLRWGRRQQDQALRETSADTVWAQASGYGWNRSRLLYGVWRVSWQDVVLVVRDDQDRSVGTITTSMQGTKIEAGGTTYRVAPRLAWRESADLVPQQADSSGSPAAACSFRLEGWIGNRRARYDIPGYGLIEVPIRWGWPWNRTPTPLQKEGETIGYLFSIPTLYQNLGRALLLPVEVPLPARLFILHKGAGEPMKTKSL